ncbi:MAG: hypothetical protein JRD04_07885 [Deltaproteobacteria bacterium]|nr:hypothetical protein [Deltaproteobacteria bacterium]
MKDHTTPERTPEEVNVEREMLSPVNKLAALSQLFDCAADGDRERLDLSGFIGVGVLLHSIVDEILEIAQKVDGRIGIIQEQEATS